ncbi:olfactory receptor 5AR1-like [Gastrophryne carolinensis]
MRNESILTELYLSGLSDLPSLQFPLFLLFLLIYLLTLTWNLLIISLIVTDSSLHTPMYFFLGNLAVLDLCYSSITVPRMLFDLHTQRRVITIPACLTQFFCFSFIISTEAFLLAIMSCDRYVAICRPLHYMQLMHWRMCVQLMLGVWCVGFTYSIVYSLFTLKLEFCKVKKLNSYFCDLPVLFQISCSDIYINILLLFTLGGFFSVVTLAVTFLPYVYIFKTVLKMQVKSSRSKVFSTCSSHLTVVFLLYGTCIFNYFRPSGSSHFASDAVVSVYYAVCTPLLNPLIYSLGNQDLRKAFQAATMVFLSPIQNLGKRSFH